MNTPSPIAVQLNDGWKPAFWDRWYQDYIIELTWTRPTKEEIEADIKEGRVVADMPCKHYGK